MHGQPPVRQDAALSPGIRTPAWGRARVGSGGSQQACAGWGRKAQKGAVSS